MTNTELLPCPFCRNRPVIIKDAISDSCSFGMFRVHLGSMGFDFHDPENECPLYGQFGIWHNTREGAVAEWNTRATEQSTDKADALEELDKLLQFAIHYSPNGIQWAQDSARIIKAALSQRPQIPQEVVEQVAKALDVADAHILVSELMTNNDVSEKAAPVREQIYNAFAALQPYRVPQPPQVQA